MLSALQFATWWARNRARHIELFHSMDLMVACGARASGKVAVPGLIRRVQTPVRDVQRWITPLAPEVSLSTSARSTPLRRGAPFLRVQRVPVPNCFGACCHKDAGSKAGRSRPTIGYRAAVSIGRLSRDCRHDKAENRTTGSALGSCIASSRVALCSGRAVARRNRPPTVMEFSCEEQPPSRAS